VSDKSSHKHVGEGALDDSDSDSADSDQANAGDLEEEHTNLRPVISPGLLHNRSQISAPSPLSKKWPDEDVMSTSSMRGQDDDEEEDEEDGLDDEEGSSPSPQPTSSESEHDSDGIVTARPRMTARTSSRRLSSGNKVVKKKTRSRSSTLASLHVPPISNKPMSRQKSDSSIQTVIAIDDARPINNNAFAYELPVRDRSAGPTGSLAHGRSKSVAVSDLVIDSRELLDTDDEEIPNERTARHPEKIIEDEVKLRQVAWDALRGALEQFAEEVQDFERLLNLPDSNVFHH
jgi:WD repeat-containing protein 24